MEQLKRGLVFIILISAVVALSFLSSSIWGGRQETITTLSALDIDRGMTVRDFAARNVLPDTVVRRVFDITNPRDLDREIETFGLTTPELLKKTNRALALGQEYESKNWVKIPVKFALWLLFLAVVFYIIRKKRLTAKGRVILYLSAVIIFGIVLGSDPSPMGTVKDAVVLFGKSGAVFPPRMIALTIFLLMSIVANKFICSWGCQFGTLQDLVFRINRDSKDARGIVRQIKIPFMISNGFRIVFFLVFSAIAVVYAFDIVEMVDPFKIYKPAAIGLGGGIFLAMILVASFFVYRPWCHLFCPFGLVSWLFEKLSIYKIKVDYDTCIACEKCAKACPSNVMDALLKRDAVIPDCFSCGTCISVCPTGSVGMGVGRRAMPPENKFTNRQDRKGSGKPIKQTGSEE